MGLEGGPAGERPFWRDDPAGQPAGEFEFEKEGSKRWKTDFRGKETLENTEALGGRRPEPGIGRGGEEEEGPRGTAFAPETGGPPFFTTSTNEGPAFFGRTWTQSKEGPESALEEEMASWKPKSLHKWKNILK